MPILTRAAHPAVALLALLTVPLLLLLAGCSTTRDATADDQSEETLKALIDLFPSND